MTDDIIYRAWKKYFRFLALSLRRKKLIGNIINH